MDLDHRPFAVVPGVHVAACLAHQHAPDELSSHPPVVLTCLGHGLDPRQRRFELRDEQFLRVAMLSPPGIFPLESPLGFFKQDDSHVESGTA
jgi:hypothetical protein